MYIAVWKQILNTIFEDKRKQFMFDNLFIITTIIV